MHVGEFEVLTETAQLYPHRQQGFVVLVEPSPVLAENDLKLAESAAQKVANDAETPALAPNVLTLAEDSETPALAHNPQSLAGYAGLPVLAVNGPTLADLAGTPECTDFRLQYHGLLSLSLVKSDLQVLNSWVAPPRCRKRINADTSSSYML